MYLVENKFNTKCKWKRVPTTFMEQQTCLVFQNSA